MAEQPDRDQPSLELPSLFRRGRQSAPEEPPADAMRRPLPPLLAATIAGALVGLSTVGLVWLAMRGCSGLRGTSSCGDPGYLVLMAVFVAMVVAGRALLAVLRVTEPGSTALLGMALVTVVALIWVVDLEAPPGAAALAVVGALAFASSQWVTSTFTEPPDRTR